MAFWIRNYSIGSISTLYSNNSVTISTVLMNEARMGEILQLALSEPEVQGRLKNAGYNMGAKFLSYIVPNEWILADLPLESIPHPEETHGHFQPKNYNQNEYKVLFTKAKLHDGGLVKGLDIIRRTHGREPVVLVRLNTSTNEILAIEAPPQHVLWGDIPTPSF